MCCLRTSTSHHRRRSWPGSRKFWNSQRSPSPSRDGTRGCGLAIRFVDGSHVRARGVCDLCRSAVLFIVFLQNRIIYHHNGITVSSCVSIGAHRVRRGTIRGRAGRVLWHDRGRGMGRRAWGWKAVGDRRGPRRSLSSCTHEVAKNGGKKKRVYNRQNPFSLFFSCPLRSFPCLGSPSLFCVRVCPPNCVSPFHSDPHALLNECVLVLCFCSAQYG
jgi:hypothetical protein